MKALLGWKYVIKREYINLFGQLYCTLYFNLLMLSINSFQSVLEIMFCSFLTIRFMLCTLSQLKAEIILAIQQGINLSSLEINIGMGSLSNSYTLTQNKNITHLYWDSLCMRTNNTCTSQCRKWNSVICRDVKLYQLGHEFPYIFNR